MIFAVTALRQWPCGKIEDLTATKTKMADTSHDSGNEHAHSPVSLTPAVDPTQAVTLISVMMFLQFFVWGSWFSVLSVALSHRGLGHIIGSAYETAPIAAIVAPLFLGLIADRYFASQNVMGVLMLLGGGFFCLVPLASDNGSVLVWLVLAHMLCYMPTLGLGNTIAFTHIRKQEHFPFIRVWGTIGWIASGLLVGILQWSTSFNIFWLAAGSSALLGLFCFLLPNTPPPLKGKPVDMRSLFMVDAFKLLADINYLIFAVCAMLICVPLAYYFGQTGIFLTQAGFAQAAATMTLGQMTEIIFMLLIPFFFRRLGLKMMILIGMACWAARYVLFAWGAPQQHTAMLLAGVALHGICYDFFFVTGFMYTDQKAPPEIRGQAQSLLVFLTQGIGTFFGYRIMAAGEFLGIDLGFTFGKYGEQVDSRAYQQSLADALGDAPQSSFLESFQQMFSRSLPDGIDSALLADTMEQWKNFWMFPAILAAGVTVLFALIFWDKAKSEGNSPE